MYKSPTSDLTEAHDSETMADARDGNLGRETEIKLRFGTAFTLKEVAEKLNISSRQVQAHIDDGSLVAVNVGRGDERRDLRVLEGDLAGFVLRRKTSAVTAAAFGRPRAATRAIPMSSANPGYAERRAARLNRNWGDLT